MLCESDNVVFESLRRILSCINVKIVSSSDETRHVEHTSEECCPCKGGKGGKYGYKSKYGGGYGYGGYKKKYDGK